MDDSKVKRLIEVLESGIVAPTKFRSVPSYWFTQVRAGQMRITPLQLKNLRRELVELRNLICKCQRLSDVKKIGDLLRDEKRLHAVTIASSAQLYDRWRGRIHADEDALETTKIVLTAAYAKINPD